MVNMGNSLGFFEISGVVAAVNALDLMVKAADVEFVTWEKKLYRGKYSRLLYLQVVGWR